MRREPVIITPEQKELNDQLVRAVISGNIGSIRHALARGADVNAKYTNSSFVRVTSAGADVEVVDSKELSALDHAVMRGNTLGAALIFIYGGFANNERITDFLQQLNLMREREPAVFGSVPTIVEAFLFESEPLAIGLRKLAGFAQNEEQQAEIARIRRHINAVINPLIDKEGYDTLKAIVKAPAIVADSMLRVEQSGAFSLYNDEEAKDYISTKLFNDRYWLGLSASRSLPPEIIVYPFEYLSIDKEEYYHAKACVTLVNSLFADEIRKEEPEISAALRVIQERRERLAPPAIALDVDPTFVVAQLEPDTNPSATTGEPLVREQRRRCIIS